MILYLDSSALVKRFVVEPGSSELEAAVAGVVLVGTGLITYAETVAALAKAVRTRAVTAELATASRQAFRKYWSSMVHLQVTEALMMQAADCAWQYGLRGYDAVHLASAVAWAEGLGEQVSLATFDRPLWDAAQSVGLIPYPDHLPALLEKWRTGLR